LQTTTTGRKPRGRKPQGRLPVVLTDGEVNALVDAVNPRCISGLRNRAMLAAMLGAGLRVSEVVGLQGRDVDLDEGVINVRAGKGGNDRVIPIDSETCGWLIAWSERRETLGLTGRQCFFCAVRDSYFGEKAGRKIGSALHPRTVQYIVRWIAKRAGIEKRVTPHTLRHTYATRLLDSGFTIREVQELLGHSDVSTTMIYTHVNPAALRAKIQGNDKRQEQIVELQQEMAELQEKLAALAAQ